MIKNTNSPKRPLIFYYGIALIVLMLLNSFLFPRLLSARVQEVDYGKFLSMIDEGNIGQVQIESNEIIFSDKAEPRQSV